MDVKHVAKLANLTVTPEEEKKFAQQFKETLKTVGLMEEIDTTGVKPTSQVTGLVNVTRADEVDYGRILPQDAVLSQAIDRQDGYFKVPAIFGE